jgi:hypothetical protein
LVAGAQKADGTARNAMENRGARQMWKSSAEMAASNRQAAWHLPGGLYLSLTADG